MILASVLYILGGLVTGFAPSLNVLIVGRLLYGIGIGLVSLLSPNSYLYVSLCPSISLILYICPSISPLFSSCLSIFHNLSPTCSPFTSLYLYTCLHLLIFASLPIYIYVQISPSISLSISYCNINLKDDVQLLQAMHGAPLYIAETSPSQIRGTLISLKELFIVLGILVLVQNYP